MTADPIQDAAELVWRHWQERHHLANLPAELRPVSRRDGYAIQARFEAKSAMPLFGWKIAATSTAGQQHIQVDGPIAGRLLAERVVESGAELPLTGNQMRVVEGEFAFRMARDLAPRAQPYTRAEVFDAIDTLHPAIEVPDSRFRPFERAGAPQLIADNACTDWFVIGAAAPAGWRDLDLVRHPVHAVCRSRDGGRTEYAGSGVNVLGDPLLALAWIANELSGIGVALQAGQTVTTGTCFKPFAVGPGDAADVDFGILGKVTVSFAL